jgi:hypothetical protein
VRKKFATREAWLEQAATLIAKEIFTPKGFTVPKVRVSIGFPGARGGLKAIGSHWTPEASDDKVGQVFISPVLSDPIDVQAVLVHELVHATVGNGAGHGKVFKACAEKVGLEGKMRATVAGKDLAAKLKDLTKKLGPLPHGRLNPGLSPTKKQGTRMLKVTCIATDYTVRMAKKWLDTFGPPTCPCCDQTMLPEETEE